MDVSDLDMAFGVRAVADLMPPREECREALNAMKDRGRKWIDFQECWFFHGIPKSAEFKPAEGIDADKALRHLSAIQGSFEPKHEHKMEAVAYLASRWFKDIKGYERRKVAA
jgi:hypothetical protein